MKMIKATEEQYMISNTHRIKVLSKAGTKLVNLFQRKNPFAKTEKECECNLNEQTEKSKTRICKCKVNSVSYQAKCATCDSEGKIRIYDGETARNLAVRSREHYDDFKNDKPTSFMKKHIDAEHGGNKDGIKFTWKVMMKNKKPLKRQLNEAVNINNRNKTESLNSKFDKE